MEVFANFSDLVALTSRKERFVFSTLNCVLCVILSNYTDLIKTTSFFSQKFLILAKKTKLLKYLPTPPLLGGTQ